jgi:hypothetical protein
LEFISARDREDPLLIDTEEEEEEDASFKGIVLSIYF